MRMAVSWWEWWLSSRMFWLCCQMQKFFKVVCALKEMTGPSWETERHGQKGEILVLSTQEWRLEWNFGCVSHQLVVYYDQFNNHNVDQVADAGVLVDGRYLNEGSKTLTQTALSDHWGDKDVTTLPQKSPGRIFWHSMLRGMVQPKLKFRSFTTQPCVDRGSGEIVPIHITVPG